MQLCRYELSNTEGSQVFDSSTLGDSLQTCHMSLFFAIITDSLLCQSLSIGVDVMCYYLIHVLRIIIMYCYCKIWKSAVY